MSVTGPLQCDYCKHYHPDGDKPASHHPTCDAFPAGIPEAFFLRGDSHQKPFPGDQGIHFEPRDPEEFRKANERWDGILADDTTDS